MLKDISIPVIDYDSENCIDVSIFGEKKFRRMLGHGGDFEVIRLVEVKNMREIKDFEFNRKLNSLLEK